MREDNEHLTQVDGELRNTLSRTMTAALSTLCMDDINNKQGNHIMGRSIRSIYL